jgi:RNA polymerase sigma-70 factor (ECF subfamily)
VVVAIFAVTFSPPAYIHIAMEPPAGDWGLLRRYALERDEAAFAQLARRHVNVVFSAALRRVGNREMAEDVTQAVFVILAKKAKGICNRDGALSAWLLKCVRFASANAIKMETRRRKHEQAACPLQWTGSAGAGACSANPTDVLVWQEIAQQLDDAVLKLPAIDRQAVLLRYFEDRAIAEIATELNMTEGAAKQRLSRAVEKLRQRLSRRAGAMMSAIDATTLAALLASHAVRSAPAGLSNAAIAAACGGASAAAGISIAKGAMTMMAWAKTKLAAAAVIGVMVIGGAGSVIAVKSALADEKKPPAEKPAATDEKKDENAPSLVTAPPVVVKSIPQAGARNVDPATTEIRVTYSKDMKNGTWSWSTWGEENFPKTTGKPHYMDDKRTCVLPVKLEPGHFYAIWLNSNNFGNFKDATGEQAVPYLLVFETKK